jgi:rSAM/selenodomain-associated transferase 2
MPSANISIIIPALNEAANIVATLTPLQPMRARGVEVIVVDGASADETVARATPLCDQVIVCDMSQRGRARQMNAGARAARGEIFLFLHADTLLPADADEWVEKAISTGRVWGRFQIAISGAHYMFPIIASFMNRRSNWTGIVTGDHGIFVTREAFEAVDGFPDQPLMEDIEFSKRMMTKFGIQSMIFVHGATITTSGRRWEKHGVWRTILLMWRLRLQYFYGADPERLYRQYYGK